MNALEKSQQGAEKSVQPTVGQFLNSAPAPAPTPAPAQPTSDVPTLPLPEDLETYPTPEAEVLPGPEVTKPEEAYPGVDVAGGARTSSVLAPSKIFDIAEPPAFAPPSLPSFVGVAKQIDLANINQGTIPGTPYDFTGQWLSNLRRDSSSVSFSDPAFSSVSRQATSRAGNWFQRLLFGSDGTIRGDGSVDTFNFMGMNLPDEGIFGNLLTGIRVGVGLIPGLTADTTRMMYSAIDPARTFGQARRMAYDWGLDRLNPASPYFAPGEWLNTVRLNLGDGPDRPHWYGVPFTGPTPPVVPPDRFLERFEATRPSATSETFTGALAKGEIPFFGLTDVRGGADGNQAFNPYAQYTREEVESWNQRDLAQQMARFRERSEQRNLSRQENPMWYALAFGTAGAVLAGRSESVRNVYNAILEVPYAITDYFRAGVGVAASNPGAAVKVFATTTADVLLDPSPIIGSVDLGADIALSVMRSVNPEAATRLGRRIEDINIPVVNRSLSDMTPTIRVPGFGRVQARPSSPSTPVETVTTSPDQLQVDMPPDLTSLDFSTMNPYEVSRVVDQIRRDYPDSGVTLRQAMQDNPGLRSRMLELQQEEVTRLAQVINPPVPTVQDTVRKTLVAKLPEVYQDVLRLRSQAAVTSDTATLIGVPPQVVNSIETRFQAFSDSVVRNGVTVDSIIELEDIQASMVKVGLTPSAQVETRQMGLQLLSARLDDLMFYASNDIRLGAFKVPATATRMATLDLKMSLRQFETAVTDITNSLGKESTKAIKAKLDIAEKAYLNAFSAKILPNVDTPIRIPTWRLDSDVQVYGVDLSQVVPVARNLNLIDEFDSLVPGDFKPGQSWNEAATQLISDHRRGLLEDLMYAKADLHEAGKAVASNPYDVASIWDYENAAKAVSRLEQAVIAVRVLEDSVKNGVNLPEPLRQLYRTQDATATVQIPEQIELNLELPEPAFVAAQSLVEGVPFPNPSAIVMPVKPSDIEKTLQALAKAFESAKNGVPVKTVAVQNKKLAKRGAKPGKSEVQNIHTQEAVTTQAVPDAAQTAEAKVAAEPGSPPASSRKPGRPVSPKTVKAEEAKVSGEVTVLPRGDEKAGTKRGFNKALYKAGQSKEAAGVIPKIPEYKPEMTQEEKKAAFLQRIEAYKALPPNELFAQIVQKGVDGYTMNQLKEIAKSRGVAVGKKDKQGLYDAIIADFRQQQNWNLKYDAVGQLRNPVEVHAGSSTKTPAIPPSTVDEAVETTPGEALQAAMEGSVQMTRADADQLVRELVEMDNKSQAPGIFAGYVQSGQVKLIDWYKRPVELEGEALIDDFFTQYVEAVNSISRAFTEQLDYAKTDELSGTLTPGQASQYRASLMTATQRALSQLNQYVQSLGLPFPVKRLSIKNWREIQRPKMKQPKVAEPVQASLETATERPVKAKKGKQTKPVKNKPGTGWYQNLTDRKGNPVTDLEELGLDLDDQFGKVFLDLRTQMLKQTSSAKTVEEAEEIFEKYSRYVENAKKYSETTAVSLGLLETPDYSMYRLAKPDTVNLPRMDEAAKLELGDYQNKEVADLKAEIKKIEAAIDRLYKSDRPNQSAADKLFEKLDRLDAALKAATGDAETAYSNNLVNYTNVGSIKSWYHSGVDLDAVKVSLVSSGEAFSNELISSLDYVHPDLLKAVDWERVVLFSSADQGIPDSIKQGLEAYEIGGFSARVDGMDYIWVSEYSLETPLIAHEVFHTAVRQNPAMLDNVVKSLDRTVLEAYPLWESFKPVYEEAVSTFSKYAGSNPVAFFEDTKFLFAQMVNQLEQQVYDSPSWASGTYLFWMGLQSVSNAWIDAGGFMSFKTLLDASRAVESVDEIVGRNLVEELAAYRLNWNPEYYDDLARLNPPKIPDALTLVNKSYVDYLGGSQPIKLGSLLDQNAKLAEQIVSESDLVPNGVTLGEDSSLAASVGNSKPIEELASRLKNTGGADVVLPESVTAGYTKQDHSPSLIESVMAQYYKEGTTSGFYRVKAMLDYVPGSVLTSFYKEGLTLLHLDDLRQLEGLADHFVRLQNDPMYISFGNILVTSDDIGVLTKEMNHVEASLDDVADILGQLEPYRNDPLLQAVGLNLPKFQKKVLEGHSELSLKDRLADWLLRMYQDLGYMWINQLLRKGPTYFADLYPNADASERAFYIKKGEILSRLIPHIDEALNSAVIAPTMQQDKVYRGFTNPKLSFKKGDVISHPFYLSTSQELTVAQGFSGPESWLFEIKGVKGPKLAKDFESEVLLPRNTELRVTDVQGYKVTLEYIGPPVNPKRKALLEGTAEPTAKPVEPEPTKTEDGPKPLESFVEGATSAEDVYRAYYVANSGGEKAWNTYKNQMTGLKGEKGWNKIVNDWFKKYKKTTGVDIKFSRPLSRPKRPEQVLNQAALEWRSKLSNDVPEGVTLPEGQVYNSGRSYTYQVQETDPEALSAVMGRYHPSGSQAGFDAFTKMLQYLPPNAMRIFNASNTVLLHMADIPLSQFNPQLGRYVGKLNGFFASGNNLLVAKSDLVTLAHETLHAGFQLVAKMPTKQQIGFVANKTLFYVLEQMRTESIHSTLVKDITEYLDYRNALASKEGIEALLTNQTPENSVRDFMSALATTYGVPYFRVVAAYIDVLGIWGSGSVARKPSELFFNLNLPRMANVSERLPIYPGYHGVDPKTAFKDTIVGAGFKEEAFTYILAENSKIYSALFEDTPADEAEFAKFIKEETAKFLGHEYQKPRPAKVKLAKPDGAMASQDGGVNQPGSTGGTSVSTVSPDVGNPVDTRQFGTTNDYGPGVYATTSRDRAAQYANSIGHTKPGTVYGNPSVDSYRVKPGTTYARTTQRWLDLHTRRDYDGLAKLNQEALDAGIQVLITPKEDFIILDPNAVDHSGRSAIEPLDSAYAMRVSEYNARMDSGLPTDEIRMAAAEQGIFEVGKHYEDILVSAGNKWFDEASAELGEFTNLRQQAKQDLKGVSTVSEQFSKAWEETQKCL